MAQSSNFLFLILLATKGKHIQTQRTDSNLSSICNDTWIAVTKREVVIPFNPESRLEIQTNTSDHRDDLSIGFYDREQRVVAGMTIDYWSHPYYSFHISYCSSISEDPYFLWPCSYDQVKVWGFTLKEDPDFTMVIHCNRFEVWRKQACRFKNVTTD